MQSCIPRLMQRYDKVRSGFDLQQDIIRIIGIDKCTGRNTSISMARISLSGLKFSSITQNPVMAALPYAVSISTEVTGRVPVSSQASKGLIRYQERRLLRIAHSKGRVGMRER